jgi:hypothetical protein
METQSPAELEGLKNDELVLLFDSQGRSRALPASRLLPDQKFVRLSPEQQRAYRLTGDADSASTARYQAAVKSYYAAVLRLGADEQLSDGELAEFHRSAYICQREHPEHLAQDLAEAKKILAARQWLAEHENDAREIKKVETQIRQYEAQLQDFLAQIRSKAAPYHERLAKLIANIPYMCEQQRQSAAWEHFLAGHVQPPEVEPRDRRW